MFNIAITQLSSPPLSTSSIEMVERKGVGHPDTLCDALAETISAALIQEIPVLQEAQCYLVSCIGQPVNEPQVVDIRVRLAEPGQFDNYQGSIVEITHQHLQLIQRIQDELVAGHIKVY